MRPPFFWCDTDFSTKKKRKNKNKNKNKKNLKSWCHTKRRAGAATRACPFGMTTTGAAMRPPFFWYDTNFSTKKKRRAGVATCDRPSFRASETFLSDAGQSDTYSLLKVGEVLTSHFLFIQYNSQLFVIQNRYQVCYKSSKSFPFL